MTTRPSADHEYTAAERKVIDAQLRKAADGPSFGPFATVEEAITFLHKELRKRKPRKS